MKEDIILDSFKDYSPQRFSNGLLMYIASNVPNDPSTLTIDILTCCSSVKNTKLDWNYFIPSTTSINCVKTWIDEIAPNFPSLDIKVITIPKKEVNNTYVLDTDINENNSISVYTRLLKSFPLVADGYQTTRDSFSFELPLSERTNIDYGVTCKKKSKTGTALFYIGHPDFTLGWFLSCYLENSKNTTLFETLDSITDTQLERLLLYIKNLNEFAVSATIDLNKERILRSWYTVNLSIAVDIKCIKKQVIIDHIRDILKVEANRKALEDVIKYLINLKNEERNSNVYYAVRALYSKKKYSLEAYLAHHLIRAAFSSDFAGFIRQYFLIKKQLPNVYFWNLILMTQFGFNYYYYYWLTNQRVFKLLSKEAFETKLREFSGYSSLEFFSKIVSLKTPLVLENLGDIYKEGNFKKFYSLLTNEIIVTLKPEKKDKFINLKLKDQYAVAADIGNSSGYYYILGDDYRIRKYKKNNFNTKRIKIK